MVEKLKWKTEKRKVNCKICGKEFHTHNCWIKRGGGKFCSKKCHGIWNSKNKVGENSYGWKGGKVKKICQVCGKEFLIKLAIKDIRITCSRKCLGIWRSKNMSGKNSSNWKGGKVKRICLICGKEFYVKSYLIKKGWGKFCSRGCKGIWIIKHQKRKNTSIEILIEQELIKNKIPYQKQVPILTIALVDFLLPNKVIIQCDGDYWHSKKINKGKDIAQDVVLNFNGYKVYRFTETEINKSASKCIMKINKKAIKI